jgi:hypothetical protein
MTHLFHARSFLAVALPLFVAVGSASAQGFEDGEADPWRWSGGQAGDFYQTTGEITDERAYNSTNSAKVTLKDNGENNKAAFRTFPNDRTVSKEDVLEFWVYVESDQVGDIDGLQPLIEYGPDFDNNTFVGEFYQPPGEGGSEFKLDEWHTLTLEVPEEADGENLLTAGMEIQGTADDVRPTIYLDDITFAGDPLPVELASFTGTADGRDALIRWQTASESNNAGFKLLHKAPDAESSRKVAFIEGVGTTTEAQQYKYQVSDLSAGTHRFQLEQVDLDGSTSLSDPLTLTVGAKETRLELVGANPFSTTTQVEYTVEDSAPLEVVLYDVMGRKVRTLVKGSHPENTTRTVTVDGSDLSSGIYFLRLKTERVTRTRKLTVTR